MSARQTVYLYLAFTLLLGFFSGALSTTANPTAPMVDVAWLLLTAAMPYVWFYLDSAERRFPRTYRWSAAIILIPVLAVPLYLAKSRPDGKRLKALGKFLIVLVSSIGLPLLGALPFIAA